MGHALFFKCTGDAGRTIATEAIRDFYVGKKMVVVSEDIDVLLILTALSGKIDVDMDNDGSSFSTFENQDIYFLKPKSSSGTEPQKIFSTKSLDDQYANTKNHLLFAHCFTGCDTTSAFFKKGKKHFSKV